MHVTDRSAEVISKVYSEVVQREFIRQYHSLYKNTPADYTTLFLTIFLSNILLSRYPDASKGPLGGSVSQQIPSSLSPVAKRETGRS